MAWDDVRSNNRDLPPGADPTQYVDADTWNGLVAHAKLYDLALFSPGVPAANAVLGRWAIVRALSFSANVSGSRGSSIVAATASCAMKLQKNGADIGTITFGAGGSTAAFSCSAFTLAAGDTVQIVMPSSTDSTLSDISITLAGFKV